MKRGEIWWADLGPYRPREQTGRRPVIVWQSDHLTRALQSILVVPMTTNLARAQLAGTAVIESIDGNPPQPSLALAFQMRAVHIGAAIEASRRDERPPLYHMVRERFDWLTPDGRDQLRPILDLMARECTIALTEHRGRVTIEVMSRCNGVVTAGVIRGNGGAPGDIETLG